MTTAKDPVESRWQRLRGHGAFQAAVLFASAAWFVLQAADVFELPTAAVRILGAALLVIFGVLIVYAWFDTRRADTGSSARPNRRRTIAVAAAAIVLVALGALIWIYRPRLFGGVRAGADVIAVLPFSTSGPSVSLLGEGLVDLLSTNLNAVGPIRTVDPRTTLHRWRQAATSGGLDLDGSLAIGKEVNAGSVLMGSVVEAAGRARLNAELFAVDGDRLAAAEIEGSADSVFLLVDQLSVLLLRDIWRSREPIPELRLSSLTTSSPSALRAYLVGEKYFRASQWDSARASFEAAIAEDSTFALAYARLGETFGWTESLGAAAAQRASEAAERFGSKLPARDRTLLSAHRLHEAADLATIDTMRRFVSQYPDDAAGWHLLGDAQYHARVLLDLTPDQIYQPFDRVLELDPSFTPAVEHPMEFAILLGDSARFAQYQNVIGSGGDSEQSIEFGTLRQIRWGPSESRLAGVATAFRATRSTGDYFRILTTYFAAAMRDAAPDPDQLEAVLDSVHTLVPAGSEVGPSLLFVDAVVAASIGRIRRANQVLDTLGAINRGTPFAALFSLMAAGLAPPALAPARRAILDSIPESSRPPYFSFWLAWLARSDGDAPLARQYLAAIPDGDSAGLERAVVDALDGLVRVEEGDTAAGLQQVRDNIRRLGYAPTTANYANQLTIEVLLIELAVPETREQALRRLESLGASMPNEDFMYSLRIADAYERAGEYGKAAQKLARFVAVWERGDPEVQDVVASARSALQRVTAER